MTLQQVLGSHIAMIVFVAIFAIVGIVSVKYFGPNNSVEKVAEEVIKEETGIDVKLDQASSQAQTPVVPPASTTPPSPASPTGPTGSTQP